MKVIKRDETRQEFTDKKIFTAITKANSKVPKDIRLSEEQIQKVVDTTIKFLPREEEIPVEEIHKSVENALMKHNFYDVARQYVSYRQERDKARERKSELRRIIKEKLTASNVQNQNANVDEYSFGGRKGEADSEVMKQLALDEYVSDTTRKNHLNNEVYIHDLDSYVVGMHNCLSMPFDDLLKHGFNTRQTAVRPAGSVGTAFQLVAVLFQLQSLQQFGGVSATHIDWSMVPYVRKSFFKHYLLNEFKNEDWFLDLDLLNMKIEDLDDRVDSCKKEYLELHNLKFEDFTFDNKDKLDKKLYQAAIFDTIRETQQAVEGMYHNLNTLQSRSGNQLPFTSINYGTCTLPEGRMIIKALLTNSLKGVGPFYDTPIFPCGIFQYWKGVNDKPGTPNYDLFRLAIKSTTKRLYPNYANVDWSGNAGYDPNDPRTYFSTMGCRTASGFDINGFGQLKDGRGNICPTTIIMPTLAMKAKRKSEKSGKSAFDEFMIILDKKIHEAKDSLIERFDYICSQPASSAKFMYENNTMAGYVPEEGIRSALKHGTLALGQIGMAETLQILIGKDHTTDEGMECAKKIEQLFKDRCAEFKKEWHGKLPETELIEQKMIKNIEARENRLLSDNEKSQIHDFCISKHKSVHTS